MVAVSLLGVYVGAMPAERVVWGVSRAADRQRGAGGMAWCARRWSGEFQERADVQR